MTGFVEAMNRFRIAFDALCACHQDVYAIVDTFLGLARAPTNRNP